MVELSLASVWERILSGVETDLSELTLIPNTDFNRFQVVPRVEGFKPLPPPRAVQAKPKGVSECPLCVADSHAHSVLWHAYGGSKVTQVVKAAQDLGMTSVNAQVVRNHFRNHFYLQPIPLKRSSNQEMLEAGQNLTDREKQILLAVYRQRMLTSKQIDRLFFEPTTNTPGASEKSAYRTLHKLRFSHYLYQYRQNSKKAPEVFYFLGRWGAPYVESQEGRLVGSPYMTQTEAESFSGQLIRHDVDASEIFVQLRGQAYTNRDRDRLVSVGGKRMTVYMPTECWWGARSLGMNYTNPLDGSETRLIPDGFAALTLNDGHHLQFRLPFFLEWDSGSKAADDTASQMSDYISFNLSGAVAERFPQLRAPGYCPPVLMVTNSAQRAYRLAQLTRAVCAKHSPDSVPPMFITDRQTMLGGVWAPGAWRSIHSEEHDQSLTLADHLLAANARLIEHNPLHWRQSLVIDLEGARNKGVPPQFMRAS